jgi:tetratricopeptide (TPR) repeat protein
MRRPNAFPALHEAIGDAQTQLGQLDSAQTNLTLALNGFRQMKDSVGIAMAMRDLGSIQSAQGNSLKEKSQEKMAKEKFEQAIDWFDQALESLRSEKKQDLQIDIVARRAVALAHLGEVDTAIDTLNAACKHWETQKHTRWVAQTDYQMAQVELIRGNRARAKKFADESINGFSLVNDKFGVAKVRELISQP